MVAHLETDTGDITHSVPPPPEPSDQYLVLYTDDRTTRMQSAERVNRAMCQHQTAAAGAHVSRQAAVLTFSSMKLRQPSLGTNAAIFLPFLMSCTRAHFRMAELGCLASMPLHTRQDEHSQNACGEVDVLDTSGPVQSPALMAAAARTGWMLGCVLLQQPPPCVRQLVLASVTSYRSPDEQKAAFKLPVAHWPAQSARDLRCGCENSHLLQHDALRVGGTSKRFLPLVPQVRLLVVFVGPQLLPPVRAQLASGSQPACLTAADKSQVGQGLLLTASCSRRPTSSDNRTA